MRFIDLIIISVASLALLSLVLWNRKKLLEAKEKQRIQALIEKFSDLKEVNEAHFQYEQILNSNRSVSKVEFPEWYEKWKYLKPMVDDYCETDLSLENDAKIRALKQVFLIGDIKVKEKNSRFVQQELSNNKVFFDNIEDHPLTENQRNTIVVDLSLIHI